MQYWEKQIWFCFLYLWMGNFSHAQITIAVDTVPLEFYRTHYETNNGLMQNTIKDLAYDNAGFLWMITEKGVSRFDGSNFLHYFDADLQLRIGLRSGQFALIDSILYLNNLPTHPIKNGKLEINLQKKFLKKVEFGVGKQYSSPDNYRFFGKTEKDTIIPYYDAFVEPFFPIK